MCSFSSTHHRCRTRCLNQLIYFFLLMHNLLLFLLDPEAVIVSRLWAGTLLDNIPLIICFHIPHSLLMLRFVQALYRGIQCSPSTQVRGFSVVASSYFKHPCASPPNSFSCSSR